jgi:hypothetical protein
VDMGSISVVGAVVPEKKSGPPLGRAAIGEVDQKLTDMVS